MQIRYRSDIDGLRALAIIFVLLFHGNLNIFPSDFIGVDIFFIISGFLISSIVKNAIDNDKFSFCEFYRRRLWRLQPPLLALIVFTLVLAIIFYLPEDFIDFAISEKYTTLLLSNQYFSRATTGYAVQDANFLLLLHTWSLAIEWQWYLIFPITFYFLHKIKNKNTIIFILVMLTISAFLIALWSSHYDENKSYYFLISRIFEFMTGATLSLIPSSKNNKKAIFILSIY
ncbi:acyltransferase family protein [Arsenophonus sp. PmNCSU2021_1]|uniref:acyltransferase family protein n=1 Tax=Arsenophonus sp. PmNCSU2021_1 TaxID=3118989 RepID=UPI002FF04AD4